MMKSKSNFDDALEWLNNATQRVVSSRPLKERYDSEWQNTSFIKANDKEAISKMVEERRKFYHSYNKAVDSVSIRAAGEEIRHGKIPISEGVKGHEAFYNLIIHSAKKTLRDHKGALKKGLSEYLDSCYLLAPGAGSFIYQAEFELSSDVSCPVENSVGDLFEECQGDFVRSINENLAHNLFELSKFTKENVNPSYSKLIQHGIDPKLCSDFLQLFSKSAEKIEFSFDWASSCKVDHKPLPTLIVFEENTKTRLQSYKETLKNFSDEYFKNVPVYIEKKSVPLSNRNKHVVFFKFDVKNRQYKGSRDIEEGAFNELPVGDFVFADIEAVVSDTSKKIDLIDISFKL
ncbi:hypothetical protein [Vibrio sp. SSH13-20]|uniref:hypothetical protein n=1 Tax=Vibrio sp. SSH13-20 TaxID=3136668 RepID=UPI0032C41B60